MSRTNQGLTGLLGAYGSDNEDESGSGSHEGDTSLRAPCHRIEHDDHEHDRISMVLTCLMGLVTHYHLT